MNSDDFAVLTHHNGRGTFFVRKNAVVKFDEDPHPTTDGTRFYLFGDPNPQFCEESIERFRSAIEA